MARFSPVLPLIGGGKTRFQPVFVGDVAEAVRVAIETDKAAGRVYELGGPEVMTFRQVLEFIIETVERKRLLVPVPFAIMRLQAALLQFLPTPPLTVDQVRMLETDNVVGEAALAEDRTLQGLGITPSAVEGIVPDYLERFRPAGQFDKPRPRVVDADDF